MNFLRASLTSQLLWTLHTRSLRFRKHRPQVDKCSGIIQPVAYLGFCKGGHGKRAELEPITGVWGRSPQRGPAEPLVGGLGGETTLKLKHFLLLNVQWNPLIRPFFWNLETQKITAICKKYSLASCKTSPRINVKLLKSNNLHNKYSRPTVQYWMGRVKPGLSSWTLNQVAAKYYQSINQSIFICPINQFKTCKWQCSGTGQWD